MTEHRWYDDPSIASQIHAGGITFWIAAVPVSVVTGWVEAVPYVSALSIAALALAHWSAREATTAQRDLEIQLDRVEHKIDLLLQTKGPAEAGPLHP